MRKFKAGIIGGGFIGVQHVEAIRRLGYVDVLAIAGATREQAQADANTLHVERAYGHYRELLADPEIDLVHNCTPNVLHYEINRAALEADKHVLSEKPLAMNSEETADLVRIAQRSGRLAAVNFNHRGYPMVQQARAMLASGALGTVQLLHGSYLQDWLLYQSDWNWRLDPAIGGASRAVADIGSHWADLLQHVTGQRIVRIFADLHTVHPTRQRPLAAAQTFSQAAPGTARSEDVAIATEDYAAILFETSGGARGSFTVSQVSAGHKNRLMFEINGTRASARWDADAPNHLWIGHRDRPNELIDKDPALAAEDARRFMHLPGGHHEAWPDALKMVFGEMYALLRDGAAHPAPTHIVASFADGHCAALLVDAVLESARRKAWVDVRE